MAINVPRIRGPQPVQNALLDFRGVHSGLDSIRQAQQQNALLARQDRQLDMQQQRLDQAAAAAARGPQAPWWVGPDGSVHPAMLAKVEAGRPQTTTNVNMPTAQTAFQKELGKATAQEVIETNKAGAAASQTYKNLQLLESALDDPNLYTGTGGEAALAVKKAAQGVFGLPVQGVASGELVQRIGTEVALGYKDKLPGTLSDGDRKLLIDLPAGLGKSPEGNRLIVATGKLTAQYQMARAKAARAYAGELDAGGNPAKYYNALAAVDKEFGNRFGSIVSDARKMKKAAPKSITAGFPRAVNPQTGEILILKNNQWVKE